MKFLEIPIYVGINETANALININSIAYIKPGYNNATLIVLNTPHDGQTNNLSTSLPYDELRDKMIELDKM